MELHHPTELTAGSDALAACARYLDGLPLDDASRTALLAEVARARPADRRSAMAHLHAALAEVKADGAEA
ncbi:MAG: hypothetical protein ACM3SS_09335, partial [Rhodospirillaceae bacterium]